MEIYFLDFIGLFRAKEFFDCLQSIYDSGTTTQLSVCELVRIFQLAFSEYIEFRWKRNCCRCRQKLFASSQ